MQRISRLQKLLKLKKISALLITHRPNLKYLCDFGGTAGMCLVAPHKTIFLTDARYFEEAKRILPAGVKAVLLERNPGSARKLWGKFIKSIKVKRIFFEEQYLTVNLLKFLKKSIPGIRWESSQNLVEILRSQKEPSEINCIVRAQRISEKVLVRVVKSLAIGITEKEVMIMIKKLGFESGADETSFRPVVAFGSNSSVPHHEPGSRRLRKGDIVLIDMGMKYRGYCSDMTRVFFFKTAPPEKQKQTYNLVLAGQKKILENIRAGISGKKADSLARKFSEKGGFAQNFLHNSGHGIGLEIHEIPTLGPEYCEKLPVGAVITVEPGIYFENSFGIRIEDMVILDSRGARNITRFPKDLSSIIIK